MSTSNRFSVVSALVLGTCACSADPPGPPQKTTYMKTDDMEGTTGRIEWASPAAAPQAQPGRWISYADTQCDDLVPTPEWADGAWSHAALLIPHETLPGFTSETA